MLVVCYNILYSVVRLHQLLYSIASRDIIVVYLGSIIYYIESTVFYNPSFAQYLFLCDSLYILCCYLPLALHLTHVLNRSSNLL